ncbi:hypothetical protein EV193_11427 [Herbihabitans rhizosphaerae]|uniref:Uncharacterized protein n=1 Tax=Herbihabitans rhizosphaerae TaxID=1872711 RepID=A0A4Q7KCT6_9PSEU|nr:hypothetical protein [Herbihabitans rhizosphaerae]RZS31338.1 hypothetical protein EV193_11427 [Herbihabitans rhizosphaerae]
MSWLFAVAIVGLLAAVWALDGIARRRLPVRRWAAPAVQADRIHEARRATETTGNDLPPP